MGLDPHLLPPGEVGGLADDVLYEPIELRIRTLNVHSLETGEAGLRQASLPVRPLLINRPPGAGELTSVLHGRPGFHLSAVNLYTADPRAVYRVEENEHQPAPKYGRLYDLTRRNEVQAFYQDDVNRRRIVFLIDDQAATASVPGTGGLIEAEEDRESANSSPVVARSLSATEETGMLNATADEIWFTLSSPGHPEVASR
ncbi:unnamed protein product [Protopolystoma xenopodis]|uniref:Uncharacterized protein n=1 Tax=Protopolystoma xenopodis TaxID=117903 RepID=A0A448WT80_9PLAT|nr:unnamed protein product [Protopolystoma xenopodis]